VRGAFYCGTDWDVDAIMQVAGCRLQVAGSLYNNSLICQDVSLRFAVGKIASGRTWYRDAIMMILIGVRQASLFESEIRCVNCHDVPPVVDGSKRKPIALSAKGMPNTARGDLFPTGKKSPGNRGDRPGNFQLTATAAWIAAGLRPSQ
jgi:hypothetical protein